MRQKLMLAMLVVAITAPTTVTQSQQSADPTGQKTLAATISVYVFPKEGQDATQQSKDEAACYQWAVQNTGSDPFELAKRLEQKEQQAEQQKQQVAEATQGAGAKGAVRGAAVGALIGEIADDDAGEGAAIGAAAGMIGARRRARAARQRTEQHADEQVRQSQQATQQQVENFKKAFSVCLEAKNYLVKY